MALDQEAGVEVHAATAAVTEDTHTVLVDDQVGEGGCHFAIIRRFQPPTGALACSAETCLAQDQTRPRPAGQQGGEVVGK